MVRVMPLTDKEHMQLHCVHAWNDLHHTVICNGYKRPKPLSSKTSKDPRHGV